MEKTKRLPLYAQIAETLRTELLRQPDGTSVATERELMERFSVSRGTVRQAIAQLVNEGLVVRMQGSGSFRAGHSRAEIAFAVDASSIEQIRTVGQNSGFRNLSFQTVRATNAIADALALPHGAKVRRIERVRMVDERPVAYGIAYARAELLKSMPKPPTHFALLDLVREKQQLPLCDCKCTCSAVAASETDAEALGIAPGAPLLQFRFSASVAGVGPFLIDTFRMIPDYSFCLEAYEPGKM